MNRSHASLSRRGFLGGSIALGLGASAFSTARGAFAEELARTPRLTEGPFYPPKLPLDTDNDLLIINNSITPAVGEVTHLTGRVLSAQRRADPERGRRNLAVRRQGRLPRPGLQRRPERRELPGLRPFHHRLDGRILLPHHQAGALPGPDAAHSRQGQEGRQGAAHDAALHQRPSAEQDGRRLRRRPRSARPGTGPGRFQADQGLENRRTDRPASTWWSASRPPEPGSERRR